MLLIKFLIAKFRQLRHYIRKEVWRLRYIDGIPYCDCFSIKSDNYSEYGKQCMHGFPKGGYPPADDNIKSPTILKAYATVLKKRIDAEKAKDSL
jgi:hypothetical protein